MIQLYLKHLIAALAAFSAIGTLVTMFFKFEWVKEHWYWGLIGLVIVIVFSIFYVRFQTYSKKKIVLQLSPKLKLTIMEGDLFEQKGVVCIPFNEYFDTHVGDGVVGENTLHGLFINKYFKDRIPELNAKITNELKQISFVEEHPRRIKGCPTKRYPLGTCINVRDGENIYVLFALTHFDDNDTAFVSRLEYTKVVNDLMKHLTATAEDKPVYIPVFGSGLSRLGRTPQRILYHLVDILDFDDTCTINGGLNILIKSLENDNINLNSLEYIVNKGIKIDEVK